ncbi:hypothetical protein SLS60_004370 [Paraconiothyrium brasiliense]|uniref:Xylanolytic transcriptional activator regulatory domain-containing protein n=1 Tax=Paraconiothyrium brasiliense TaxID=300254 RepID=A0ABR3RK74_9PLEO
MFPESFEEQTPLPSVHEPVDVADQGPETEADIEDSAHDRNYVAELRSIHDFGDKDANDLKPTGPLRPKRKPESPIDDEQVQELLRNGEAENLLGVYRSIYHFVFSHKTQQIYFMQTTANGLALDLGLYQKSSRPLMDFPGRPSPSALSVTEQLERQRTFLGCYYLSSQVAAGMQRPNLLKYTEYMSQCSRELRDHRQYPSDAIIGHLLEIRRLDDQIQDCFFTEETAALDITDPRISMNFRFLESQLEQWKRGRYSDEYQIPLRAPPTTHQGYTADSTRLNALLATLEACKRFLDTLLACPPSNYHILGFSEWFRIPLVAMTLARLCIPSDTHTAAQWDVKAAHERGRLDLYLESLCYRMKGLSTYKRTQSFHHDFYWALEMIMDSTKIWFVKKVNARTTRSNGIPTPDTMQSLTNGLMADGSGDSSTSAMPETGGCPYAALDQDSSMNGDIANDPFAFMRDVDFDMDK